MRCLQFLAISILIFSCDDEEPPFMGPANQGTMSALINGEEWVADTLVTGDVDLEERFFGLNGDGATGDMFISVGNYDGPGSYDLSSEFNLVLWTDAEREGEEGMTFAAGFGGGSGSIEINQDGPRYFGTFNFEASNSLDDEISVVDGVYDIDISITN